MVSQRCKRPRRRPYLRWSDKIRKEAGVNWVAKALDWNYYIGKNLGGNLHSQWIEND